jgi:hypothetical protein
MDHPNARRRKSKETKKPDASAIANTDIKGLGFIQKVRNSKRKTNPEIVKTPLAMARDFQNSENMQKSKVRR